MKKCKWWFRVPGMTYACSFSFEQPATEREARAHVRWWLGKGTGGEEVKRLPRGTEVWPG